MADYKSIRILIELKALGYGGTLIGRENEKKEESESKEHDGAESQIQRKGKRMERGRERE